MRGKAAISRRSFLAAGTIVGGGALLGLAGCASGGTESRSADTEQTSNYPNHIDENDFAESSAVVDDIAEFVDEKTFDIVVVGAGVAGLPAVLTALEEGASVACLQKESAASGNGNFSSGLIVEESDDQGIMNWMQSQRRANLYRVNWDLLRYHAYHSGETVCFMDKVTEEIGYSAPLHTIADSVVYEDGTRITYAKHAWKSNNLLVQELAKHAEQEGAEFFYKTPGVQLVTSEDGAVTGVIGNGPDGYIKFNANVAVILATGDYECNESMKSKFCPDLNHVQPYQINRTGDGHLMAIAVGAQMVPQPHAKQAHDVFSTTFGISATPLLSLDHAGKRFMNEDASMPLWLNSTRYFHDQEDRGTFFRFFDDAFDEKYTTFPPREDMEKYIVGQSVPQEDTSQIPYEPGLIGCHRADSIAELAEEMGPPADAVEQSIRQWNEFCANGRDEDFGLSPDYMKPIDTPPYWGIANHVRIVAIDAGVIVDDHYQVLDGDYNPIPGLFAVGTAGGDLSGAADWQMASAVSNGHCMNSGRYSVIYALKGTLQPSHPSTWDEVKHLYDNVVVDSTWQKKA